ncbi:MAG: bacteriohopanetetrol glucosamine biosynthesis glycosyltransferase HpnI [Hyphomicrobiales bacterium]|nr:bacteriohopanetetrol glucosamine biosynthesis glycosyltransferase HpnI [Hyphomicrobiales bacterium]
MSAGLHGDPALWAGCICSFAAALGVGYLALASILILRFKAEPAEARPGHAIPVLRPLSILVPLCGEDGHLYERLCRLCRQNYAGPIELVCGLQDPDDPAIGIVNAVAAKFSQMRVALRIDAKEHGGNRKISNLMNIAASARTRTLMLVDSDIVVGPDHLSRIVAELEKPGVGAVTCLYHGLGGAGVWSSLSALSINAHFLPSVIVALAVGVARPCFGSTIALPRQILDAIGGLEAFVDCLHDDYAIGQRVREAGYRVAIPRFSVGHVCREESARDLMQNQIRAARTIKMINPVGYTGSIVSHPTAFALPAALLGGAYGVPLLLLALVGRLIVCLSVERAFSLPRQRYWLLPFYDLLFVAVYFASFFGARVSWRGERYRLNGDGTLVHDAR